MSTRAFITGISGTELTAVERALARVRPLWRFISFKPGLQSSAQVTGLIEKLTSSGPAATNPIGLSIPVDGAADLVHPPTTSATMIAQVIRSAVGVQGLLMSDDVSTMNAPAGGIAERVRAMFVPGCDTAFHSNDNAELDALTANTASA